MGHEYRPAQCAFQDRFDTRRLADRLAESVGDVLDDARRVFFSPRPGRAL